jgi:hypothetical protein
VSHFQLVNHLPELKKGLQEQVIAFLGKHSSVRILYTARVSLHLP